MNEKIKGQMNIVQILDILLERWIVVLLSAVFVGVFTFLYSEIFIAPVYSSSALLYVNSNRQQVTEDISQANIYSSRELVMTYAEILQTRTSLSRVAAEFNGKYSINQIKSMITMSPLNETEILTIAVKGTNPEDVYNITRSIVRYAPDELEKVVEAGSVKILDDASKTTVPISPNVRRNTFIGVFFGILLGALIVIILELFDTRIKSSDEITMQKPITTKHMFSTIHTCHYP